MAEWEDEPRDLAALTVCLVGSVVDTGDPWEPWRLLDPAGVPVEPVSVFLRDLLAVGRPATTQRCSASAILRMVATLVVRMDRASLATHRDLAGCSVAVNVAEIVTVSSNVDSLLPGQTAGTSRRPHAVGAASGRH